MSGDFTPENINHRFAYFNASDDNSKLINIILKQKADIICINDANKKIDFKKAKTEINDALTSIMPEKSSFEL